ncbi:MAG: SDR family NAD(P)-dependent oxidoreductase, partial [Chloroflexota bacterium]
MIDPGLAGRVGIVTGANHGIGAATARTLAAQGVAVFVTYLRGQPPSPKADLSTPGDALYRAKQAQDARWVVDAIVSAGGRAAAWEADLANPRTLPELFDRAEAAFGPVGVLVNNATHCVPTTFRPDGGLTTISTELHDAHFAVN